MNDIPNSVDQRINAIRKKCVIYCIFTLLIATTGIYWFFNDVFYELVVTTPHQSRSGQNYNIISSFFIFVIDFMLLAGFHSYYVASYYKLVINHLLDSMPSGTELVNCDLHENTVREAGPIIMDFDKKSLIRAETKCCFQSEIANHPILLFYCRINRSRTKKNQRHDFSYSGFFVQCLLNDRIKSPIITTGKDQYDKSFKIGGHLYRQIKILSPFLRQNMIIFGSDQVAARTILQPAVIEQIECMYKNRNFHFSLIENRLSIFIKMKAPFSPRIFLLRPKKLEEKINELQTLFNDITNMLKILDRLVSKNKRMQ